MGEGPPTKVFDALIACSNAADGPYLTNRIEVLYWMIMNSYSSESDWISDYVKSGDGSRTFQYGKLLFYMTDYKES